ncbi:MAG: ribbon-helix-helix protein, CopG family [Candidatus Saccharimonadales bacterium]
MGKLQSATVSFSVDTELRDDLNKLAASEKRSKSDLFREMYNYYRFKLTLNQVQEHGSVIAQRLGLETDDDVYEYLAKNRKT